MKYLLLISFLSLSFLASAQSDSDTTQNICDMKTHSDTVDLRPDKACKEGDILKIKSTYDTGRNAVITYFCDLEKPIVFIPGGVDMVSGTIARRTKPFTLCTFRGRNWRGNVEGTRSAITN